MQKIIIPAQKMGDTVFRIWQYLTGDSHESNQVPQTPPIEFRFTKAQPKVKKEKPIAAQPLPLPKTESNVVERITLQGIRKERITPIEWGIDSERIGEKTALVSEVEMKDIVGKFPAIDKNAVVICKRGWAKNMSNLLIVAELKKENLQYGETYIKAMKSVFNKNREVVRV